jgi:thioredoxin-related protein
MPMRSLPCFVLAAALLIPGDLHPARAAVGLPAEQSTSSLELIVIEARGCPLCQLFRDEIAPAYRATSRAKQAPLRFVDVSFTDPVTLNLVAPIEIVPTVVLMRDGAEIDRLVGYTGPEIFMSVVGKMLGDAP